MKAQIFSLLIIIGIGFITSCSNIDDHLEPEKAIDGTWNLINKKGGLASFNIDYQKGDIKWTFSESNNTLIVVNNIGNENAFHLHSGTYNFDIEQNGESQVLFVNDNDYRMVILSIDQNLTITDAMNDGFTAEFIK